MVTKKGWEVKGEGMRGKGGEDKELLLSRPLSGTSKGEEGRGQPDGKERHDQDRLSEKKKTVRRGTGATSPLSQKSYAPECWRKSNTPRSAG